MNYFEIKNLLPVIFLLTAGYYNAGCQHSINENGLLLKIENFQKKINNKNVSLYFLKNGHISLAITNYGARIVSLCTPAKNGEIADIVTGFKSIDDYIKATGVYHGAIIGRVAGRIKHGVINLNAKTYTLQSNSGNNHLHGGSNGFHNQVWDIKSWNDTSLVLTYWSIDGEMGYPGNVIAEVAYVLTAKNELLIEYKASTDKTTPINLTNHAFFNLAGEGSGSINDHLLTIDADYICPLNDEKLAIGKKYKVKGMPFDFRKSKPIGQGLSLENTNEQLKIAGGYDHHFVLKKKKKGKMTLAATIVDPKSGRKMEVLTLDPCIHFFSANFFKGTDTSKSGKPINYRESFALETQRYPYSNDHSAFPTIILNPGDQYKTKTIFRFSVLE